MLLLFKKAVQLWRYRQYYGKRGAYIWFTGYSDAALVVFHNFFTQGKAYTRAGIIGKALKNFKNLLGVLLVKTFAIICNGDFYIGFFYIFKR